MPYQLISIKHVNQFYELNAERKGYYSISSISDHGVRLAGAGLPIGKQTTMEALECIVEDFFSDCFVDSSLVIIGVIGGYI